MRNTEDSTAGMFCIFLFGALVLHTVWQMYTRGTITYGGVTSRVPHPTEAAVAVLFIGLLFVFLSYRALHNK